MGHYSGEGGMRLWRRMIQASDAVLNRFQDLENPDAAIAAAHLEAVLEWLKTNRAHRLRQELKAAWAAAGPAERKPAIVPQSRGEANAPPTPKGF